MHTKVLAYFFVADGILKNISGNPDFPTARRCCSESLGVQSSDLISQGFIIAGNDPTVSGRQVFGIFKTPAADMPDGSTDPTLMSA